jgi:hypothetical protein
MPISFKFLEIRPISGQGFYSLLFFTLKLIGKGTETT